VRGFHVLAGVRRDRDADAIRGPGIEPLIMDVTNLHHIQALVTRVCGDAQGRPVRALVNNAGIGVNVPFEAFAIDEWRRLFEVNFFGHVAVTQALLAALIRAKGRVVNISSVGGKVAMATYGPYAGTTFALEAVSDSWRREMAPFGFGVIVVEPGAVRTEMPGRAIATAHELASAMTVEQNRRYGPLLQAITAQAAAHTTSGSGLAAEAVAEVIAKAVTTRKPRTRPRRRTDHPVGALPTRPNPRPRHRRRSAAALPRGAGARGLTHRINPQRHCCHRRHRLGPLVESPDCERQLAMSDPIGTVGTWRVPGSCVASSFGTC
jgi:NAD(P)-dependent dehydrogenase (short-subunit alcohol dehydrogenase family)